MGAIIKHLSDSLPNELIVFFRNAFAFLLLTPLIFWRQGLAGFKTSELGFHLLRGAIGVSAMSCFFYILGKMQFTEAILLKLTTPFFIPLVALLWLRERSSIQTLFAIALGFVGVICIVDPATRGLQALDMVAIGLLGALLAAFAKVCIRRMRHTEPSLRIVFYFSVFASLCSAPFAYNSWVSLQAHHYLWLALLAGVATVGQLLITAAYRRVSAGKIGQFTYTSLVFSSLMGWLIWQEALTTATLLGCLFIVTAGLLNMRSK